MYHNAQRSALITGVNGQDGPYLAAFLIAKGYRVHGLVRRASGGVGERVRALADTGALQLHYGDMSDGGALMRILSATRPDEIYNLAAQSDVGVSFACPEDTIDTVGLGVVRLLEAVRVLGLGATTRILQASSSELYGDTTTPEQDETTPFAPRSPYAGAKLMAYWVCVNYRDGYGMHVTNAIMFNHESPWRGEDFVTRKITRAAAAIAAGRAEPLALGNLDAQRDWSHSRDMTAGMWRALQHETPGDFVFASGQSVSVRQFATWAFAEAGIALDWHGEGAGEVACERASGRRVVVVDPKFFRPTEVPRLSGNADKARTLLGWRPETSLRGLIAEMVAADRARLAPAARVAAQ